MTQYIKIRGIMQKPHLLKPHLDEGETDASKAKYKCGIFLHKNDSQNFALDAAIDTEIKITFPNGFPNNGKFAKKDAAEIWPEKPELHDYWLINTSSTIENKPHVVTQSSTGTQPVIDPGEVRAGDYAWFALAIRCFDTPKNKGYSAYVNGVLLTGETSDISNLSGGKPSADKMFAEVLKPAAATPPPIVPPAAPAAVPIYTMTPAANGLTREAYHASGWSDQQLIEHGYMVKS